MEAVGRVAGSLAHDFGNLLSVVRGWSELLLAESLDDHVRDGLEAIQLASDRGADLVRDLLTFSRTRSGQIQPVDLAEHVGRVERMLARTVGSGITIEVGADPSVPPARARRRSAGGRGNRRGVGRSLRTSTSR